MTARVRFPKTAVAAALKKLGVDPVAELVKLAQTTDSETIAMRVWMELLQYLAPRMRAIEITEKAETTPTSDAVARAKQEIFGFE